MNIANINKTDDLNYKAGFVQCACGWHKELGNGFNGYHIDNCPSCTPELSTRLQRKVTYGKAKSLTVEIGKFIYFVISNGCNIQYSRFAERVYNGLSKRQADNIQA